MFIKITDQKCISYGEQIINTDMIAKIILRNGYYWVVLCDNNNSICLSREDAQKLFRVIGTSI